MEAPRCDAARQASMRSASSAFRASARTSSLYFAFLGSACSGSSWAGRPPALAAALGGLRPATDYSNSARMARAMRWPALGGDSAGELGWAAIVESSDRPLLRTDNAVRST